MEVEEATASRGIRLNGPIEIPSVVARYYCSIISGWEDDDDDDGKGGHHC